MVNYQNGKIYKLVSLHTDKIYVGSTTKKYLCERKSEHKNEYKKWKNGKHNNVTSFQLFELGIDDVDIILLENYPCNSKNELHARERHYVESMNCVNKVIPNRTEKEYNQMRDKQKTATQQKQYRNVHKEEISERRKKLEHCETCNCDVRKNDFSRHERSKKHQENMSKQ
jgi:hypothetical protein